MIGLFIFLYLVVDVTIALKFGLIAKEKGFGFGEYFWLCFGFGPAGWAMVIALPDRRFSYYMPTYSRQNDSTEHTPAVQQQPVDDKLPEL